MTWIMNNKKLIVYTLVAVVIAIGGYFLYQYFHPVQTVTGESQAQAETTQGIDLAAKNAHINMLQDQLIEALDQIRELKNKSPDTIIKTVPVEVIKTVEKEVAVRGADFAIVTDPQNPDKQVDLKEIANLPANTDVTLNQYNVFAYKKVFHDWTIYPSFKGVTPSGINEVSYGINRKITKDGKYLGIVTGYEFDDKKAKIGLRITY